MHRLHVVDAFGDCDDCFLAGFEGGGECGDGVCFLLEDEAGEERDYFGGRVGREGVFEDELGEDEFVC